MAKRQAAWQQHEAENQSLHQQLQQLEAENDSLRQNVHELEQLVPQLRRRIEELERATARQAAPFRRKDKDKKPPDQHKRPGRPVPSGSLATSRSSAWRVSVVLPVKK